MSVIDLQYVHSVSARLEKFARKKKIFILFAVLIVGTQQSLKIRPEDISIKRDQTIFSNVIIVELAEHSLIS